MPARNTSERYGLVSITFHWVIALLVFGLLGVGLYMVDLPVSLQKIKLYGLHKEIGLIVLFLASLRLFWRLSETIPLLPDHMPGWQRLAARLTHFLLYVCLFVMPVSGWLMSSATGFPVSFFGLFTMPDLVAPSEELRVILQFVHETVAYGLIGLIAAHVGAALFHVVIYKDNIFRRILP
jgi:cytochrome b561